MKKFFIKIMTCTLAFVSFITASPKAEKINTPNNAPELRTVIKVDGYDWDYGYAYTLTFKHVQYSKYAHGKKDHSATAMVDNVYDKDTKGPGKMAHGEVEGSRNPSTYNSYYNYW
ncbi:lactococcin 972 family bacteriocin [Clostridium sp.]|uniref:lactococcin 972 family bacteriocin n=1 Tax=Clostridium sp. TaxID=1506 RepID=UPI003F2BDE57